MSPLKRIISYSILIGLSVILLWCLVCLIKLSLNTSECLEYGYPEAKMTWGFETYCVRKEFNGDRVVKLETLR